MTVETPKIPWMQEIRRVIRAGKICHTTAQKTVKKIAMKAIIQTKKGTITMRNTSYSTAKNREKSIKKQK